MPQKNQASQSMNLSLNLMVADLPANYSPVVHGTVMIMNHSSMVRAILAGHHLYLKFQILKSTTLLYHYHQLLDICQGPYQPKLLKYKVTVYRGKSRSLCSTRYNFHGWLEYLPKVDKMYCFVCRAFARNVSGSVGRVDPAFSSSGTHASRWKTPEVFFQNIKQMLFISKRFCVYVIIKPPLQSTSS